LCYSCSTHNKLKTTTNHHLPLSWSFILKLHAFWFKYLKHEREETKMDTNANLMQTKKKKLKMKVLVKAKSLQTPMNCWTLRQGGKLEWRSKSVMSKHSDPFILFPKTFRSPRTPILCIAPHRAHINQIKQLSRSILNIHPTNQTKPMWHSNVKIKSTTAMKPKKRALK